MVSDRLTGTGATTPSARTSTTRVWYEFPRCFGTFQQFRRLPCVSEFEAGLLPASAGCCRRAWRAVSCASKTAPPPSSSLWSRYRFWRCSSRSWRRHWCFCRANAGGRRHRSRPVDHDRAGAQTAGFSQADFKTQSCNDLAGGLFNCAASVYVDVKTYTSFGAVNTASPITNGQFDSSKLGWTPGGPGDIVVVTLYYQWPISVSLLGNNLANGSRPLIATSVFRNEPY